MKQFARYFLVLAVTLAIAGPAGAWGPRAQISIVDTAARVISQGGSIPLKNLGNQVRDGAALPSSDVQALIPLAQTDPIGAIENEMYLLQAIRGDRVDPYFAYRLGVLGQLVASVTAPLASRGPTYRNLYYADVENNIQKAVLRASQRRIVQADATLPVVQRSAAEHDSLIIRDYQSGLGYDGIASGALSSDASRSINAVADIWYTIFNSSVAVTNLSEERVRDYILDALRFYIRNGNDREADAVNDRLVRRFRQTPDLRKQVGDMYFESGRFDRAITEYKAILVEQPNRRDVVEKMAEYYILLGDDALDDKRLDDALEAYASAIEIDKLHPSAQQKRLKAEKLIAARDKRHEEAQQALTTARDLEAEADCEALRGNYSQGIDLLRQSIALYESVGVEFAREGQEARVALSSANIRMRKLRDEFMNDAQSLSGLGFAWDAGMQAKKTAVDLNKESLREIFLEQYVQSNRVYRSELSEQLDAEFRR
jgi:tetratricopeptide (TPR) repeat protein